MSDEHTLLGVSFSPMCTRRNTTPSFLLLPLLLPHTPTTPSRPVIGSDSGGDWHFSFCCAPFCVRHCAHTHTRRPTVASPRARTRAHAPTRKHTGAHTSSIIRPPKTMKPCLHMWNYRLQLAPHMQWGRGRRVNIFHLCTCRGESTVFPLLNGRLHKGCFSLTTIRRIPNVPYLIFLQ